MNCAASPAPAKPQQRLLHCLARNPQSRHLSPLQPRNQHHNRFIPHAPNSRLRHPIPSQNPAEAPSTSCSDTANVGTRYIASANNLLPLSIYPQVICLRVNASIKCYSRFIRAQKLRVVDADAMYRVPTGWGGKRVQKRSPCRGRLQGLGVVVAER